jgi:hypothetical protein
MPTQTNEYVNRAGAQKLIDLTQSALSDKLDASDVGYDTSTGVVTIKTNTLTPLSASDVQDLWNAVT